MTWYGNDDVRALRAFVDYHCRDVCYHLLEDILDALIHFIRELQDRAQAPPTEYFVACVEPLGAYPMCMTVSFIEIPCCRTTENYE